MPPAKFQRCTEVHNCRNTKNAHCRVTLQTYFLALTFEPKINMAKTFFSAQFLFQRKTEQINSKKQTVKKSKMIFHDFFFPAGSRSKPIHFN